MCREVVLYSFGRPPRRPIVSGVGVLKRKIYAERCALRPGTTGTVEINNIVKCCCMVLY